MTSLVHHHTCVHVPARTTFLQRVFYRLSLQNSRRALSDLDPHLLRDVGISETDARRESTRKAWDAPSHWNE